MAREETGGHPCDRYQLLVMKHGSNPSRWAYFDGRQNHLRDVTGGAMTLPQSSGHHTTMAMACVMAPPMRWPVLPINRDDLRVEESLRT